MNYLRLYLGSLVPWLVLGTMVLSACGSSNNANTESNDSVIAQDTLDQTTSKLDFGLLNYRTLRGNSS